VAFDFDCKTQLERVSKGKPSSLSGLVVSKEGKQVLQPRHQLFTSPRKESRNASGGGHPPFQELETVEINDDLIFKKLGADAADSKFASIEERCSGADAINRLFVADGVGRPFVWAGKS
jgi:hypothetical protein